MAGKKQVGETVMNSVTNGFKKASNFFRNLLSIGDETAEQFPNIAFYSDEIPCYPLGDTIEKVLETWIGNYSLLQTNYLYTQWLFPNRKPGINSRASVLKDTEVEVISSTPVLRERVKRAFQMMLDFYGMRLMRDDQFELTENSEERLKELNEGRYNHNYLRITRILLALKELGHKELMLPWLNFMAGLIYREKVLNNAASSFENYWVDTLDTEDALVLKEHLELLKSNKPTETEAATLTTSNTEPDVLLSSTKLTSRNMV